MRKVKIHHRTHYAFSAPVQLGPHQLRLRPREGHELRIESSALELTPQGTTRWHRDSHDNSVVTVNFAQPTSELIITSELVCQHYDSAPWDFVLAEDAVYFPFSYPPDEADTLLPYKICNEPVEGGELNQWVAGYWVSGKPVQTYSLLLSLCSGIHQNMTYQKREEPGVQTAAQTLSLQSGSCRDFANLFMEAARMLGFAARFVSGYLYNPPSATDYGATHAWAEVFLPGAGWKGFDPTIGNLTGNDHIAVAVAKRADAVPPVSGSFTGDAAATLEVAVQVTDI
ncbi:MAG: transglutaminase family protein [Salinisphaeraceae bacterium]|nr:transglutaminase family protein [Salinisphaeraceae bacterium]